MATKQRDVIVARYSEQGERELENLHTDTIQLEAGRRWAKEQGHRVVAEFIERDVSGRLPLAKRTGLKPALDMIIAGEADNLVFAYFDRMVRKLKVQLEVIETVEQSGGDIYALDHGKLTNGTAATRLSSNMLGAVHQYYGDIVSEKVQPAHIKAVKLGRYPIAKVPPGYVRNGNGGLSVVPELKPVVVEAFAMRDQAPPAAYEAIRVYLREHGVYRTLGGVVAMLTNPVYLGEIHFGKLENLHAHEAIIDTDVFNRVQRTVTTGGRRAQSQHLLARLGVLRCDTCGALMSINGRTNKYRCQGSRPAGCTRRVAIDADKIEELVMAKVRAYTDDTRGHASVEQRRRGAEVRVADAQARFTAAFAAFEGFDVDAARERLAKLQANVDEAQAELDKLGGTGTPRKTIRPADIDKLRDPAQRLAEWRGLITDTIAEIRVAPNPTPALRRWDESRVTFKFLGQ